MWLNGAKVVDDTTFTADEFSKLTYMAGDDQSKQSIVAVAQLGTRLSDGTLSHVIDSPAIQITANVTGSRSINALNALVAPAPGADANMAEVVSETGIFTGLGAGRPTLQTAGNFDAEDGRCLPHGHPVQRQPRPADRRSQVIASPWATATASCSSTIRMSPHRPPSLPRNSAT